MARSRIRGKALLCRSRLERYRGLSKLTSGLARENARGCPFVISGAIEPCHVVLWCDIFAGIIFCRSNLTCGGTPFLGLPGGRPHHFQPRRLRRFVRDACAATVVSADAPYGLRLKIFRHLGDLGWKKGRYGQGKRSTARSCCPPAPGRLVRQPGPRSRCPDTGWPTRPLSLAPHHFHRVESTGVTGQRFDAQPPPLRGLPCRHLRRPMCGQRPSR